MFQRFLELYDYVQIIMLDQDRASEMVKQDSKRNLEEVVRLLQPLNEVTEDLSGESYATVSRVLPIINCLTNCLTSIKPLSSIGKNLQGSLLCEIQSRFDSYRVSPIYGPSMFLDPRFKDVHFKTTDERNAAQKKIIDLVLPPADGSCSDDDEEFFGEDQPPKKVANTSVWGYHEGMVQHHNTRRITIRKSDTVQKEIDMYMKCPVESMDCDIFRYWDEKKNLFPFLYQAALKLLPRIATSVPSERLFSKTGRILNETRTSLDPERVNRIIFLHNVDSTTFKNAK
ncbi:E3 SUMO-protein ligase ZBED1-like [Armigeres subalbatus]|uniref:E3 SUMO-protein ligase ZBED1-like n=1 Tax=Armigeres subalbatus TaxID=124917 RepID=UPI002ED07DAD